MVCSLSLRAMKSRRQAVDDDLACHATPDRSRKPTLMLQVFQQRCKKMGAFSYPESGEPASVMLKPGMRCETRSTAHVEPPPSRERAIVKFVD